jgi:hypothetical protein
VKIADVPSVVEFDPNSPNVAMYNNMDDSPSPQTVPGKKWRKMDRNGQPSSSRETFTFSTSEGDVASLGTST